jgi:hypothetical protein
MRWCMSVGGMIAISLLLYCLCYVLSEIRSNQLAVVHQIQLIKQQLRDISWVAMVDVDDKPWRRVYRGD